MTKPPVSNENLVINELIREYLIFNGYRETLSVFLPGQRPMLCMLHAPTHPLLQHLALTLRCTSLLSSCRDWAT